MPFYKAYINLTFCVDLVFRKTAGSDQSHFLEYKIIGQISANPEGNQFQQHIITDIEYAPSDDTSNKLKYNVHHLKRRQNLREGH